MSGCRRGSRGRSAIAESTGWAVASPSRTEAWPGNTGQVESRDHPLHLLGRQQVARKAALAVRQPGFHLFLNVSISSPAASSEQARKTSAARNVPVASLMAPVT